MNEHRAHVIAKSAFAGFGSPKITAEEPQREFLEELVCGLFIADCAEQIAVDGGAIAIHEDALGAIGGSGALIVGLADHCPHRVNSTEPFNRFGLHHERTPETKR